MTPRYVKRGEALAMPSTRLHQDRQGFYWMLGSGPLPNERKGDAMIVHVRGELEHHREAGSCAESYEGILDKFRCAYAGQVDGDSDADDAGGPPKAIIMCVDSPGGVVSGLNETVAELQRMRAEHPEVKVTCYVNEMATSAAYALACSCDKIVCPESAIIGSIGVISTMISASAADKKAGFDVRLLTSGARKADGHLHAPISDDAVAVETARVDKLAKSFFNLVSKARGLAVKKIQSLQAGIFLGKDAIREGLADGIAPFDAYLRGAQGDSNMPAMSGGNQTDRRENKRMNLVTLIKTTKAALAGTDDPKKIGELASALASYTASLEAYKKTEKHVEHVKTEQDDDPEDDPEDGEGDDAAKKAEEEKASAKKADEEEKASAAADSEDDEDEDEAKSAKKAMALVQSLTGKSGAAGRGELRAIVMLAGKAVADVEGLKKSAKAREKSELIASVTGKYFTPTEAKDLASMPLSEVRSLVAFAKKRGTIAHTDDGDLLHPKAVKPGTEESLPQFTRDMINAAVAAAPAAQREKVRADLVAANLKTHNDPNALNGAGRY